MTVTVNNLQQLIDHLSDNIENDVYEGGQLQKAAKQQFVLENLKLALYAINELCIEDKDFNDEVGKLNIFSRSIDEILADFHE